MSLEDLRCWQLSPTQILRIEPRPYQEGDLVEIRDSLRSVGRNRALAVCRDGAFQALIGPQNTITVLFEGAVAMVLGTLECAWGHEVWMVASTAVDRHPLSSLRVIKGLIERWPERPLFAHTQDENPWARFLVWLGFNQVEFDSDHSDLAERLFRYRLR